MIVEIGATGRFPLPRLFKTPWKIRLSFRVRLEAFSDDVQVGHVDGDAGDTDLVLEGWIITNNLLYL